ncbi:MAG: TetR/AcrR family transcriptional regulator [Lactobacillaceae bacterium]|jgi:AcrR family transcriptional regulator|nr:TetR/AcrR family transcriptional regulator [Lactobacillaceae bacterium]
MRIRDDKKIAAITQAVFAINSSEGISNLSIGKIAKAAGVSPATVYIYYADKTDMLAQIYLEVKRMMDAGLVDELNALDSMHEKFVAMVAHFAHRTIEHPLEAKFMNAVFANPALITPEAAKIANEMAAPIFQTWEMARQAGLLRFDDMHITAALAMAPTNYYIDEALRENREVNAAQLQQLIEASVNAVLVD